MIIHLPEDVESSISAAVHSGHFASADELVAQAVRSFLCSRNPRSQTQDWAPSVRCGMPPMSWTKLLPTR